MASETAHSELIMTCNPSALDAFCTSGTSPTVRLTGPRHAPTILVLGGISAGPDLDWWAGFVGPDAPIDPSRHRILSTSWLTSNDVTTRAQARWILEVLDERGISHLDHAIGCSYGGMVALALGELAPDRVGQIVVIGAAHRAHPLATAWRFIQRRIVALGDEGLALARALAMTTYRSDRELDARFAGRPDDLESWLEHHGEQFTRRFTEAEFIALSAAIDRHDVRAEAPDAILVVDNTFLSPALQKPLELGADVAVHSTTKYINGHSDVVGGAVIARELALGEQLGWWANCLGLTGAPFDAWLTLRGLRTLHARLTHHVANAEAVVELLEAHPAVSVVHYPGLTTHPGHAVARRQQSGPGAMVSFELRDAADVGPFVERLQHFSLAESLGGVESLVAHPATMTHASMSAEARATAGISDSLLRLSVGIEDPRDLTADLGQALDVAAVRGAA